MNNFILSAVIKAMGLFYIYFILFSSMVGAESVNATEKILSKGGNYKVIFSPSEQNIPLNEYFDLNVDIRGATNQRLKYNIKLELEVGMKVHNHGMNVQPIIENKGQGKFIIKGLLLHMPGNWLFNFKIYRGLMSDSAEKILFISY